MDFQASFKKIIAAGELSHSYIVFGDPSVRDARCLANFLENEEWAESEGILIDFLIVSPDDNDKTGIDIVREASKFLWQAPLKSPRKTLVIDQADRLTPQAQNAILKIAEEPPRHSLIFLLVRDYNLLIPPLISRFQRFFVRNEQFADISKKDLSLAVKFLKGTERERSAIIKDIAGDNCRLGDFVKSVMRELDKDPVHNFTALRELSYRWSQISRYNTNRKLQLEAWLQLLNG